MKNKILNFFFAFIILCVSALNADARVNSQADLYAKANVLKNIAQYNYSSMIGKTELIGYRMDSFNISASQYQNNAWLAYETINNINSQIDMINNSVEFSDSDKQLQINKLYQEADAALYDLDSKTMNYVYSLRNFMPSISFGRYSKKFLDFYNSQRVTDNQIVVK